MCVCLCVCVCVCVCVHVCVCVCMCVHACIRFLKFYLIKQFKVQGIQHLYHQLETEVNSSAQSHNKEPEID